MDKSPVPFNEPFRLAELDLYKILDTASEASYNDLVELAAFIFDRPYSVLSFIDGDRQWFKAAKNLPRAETSRERSFCAHTIFLEEVMVVEDASKDERFRDHPDVAGGLGVNFYAGAPIISTSGHALGTVCVFDHKPGTFSEENKRFLKMIARQASRLLELGYKNRIIIENAETTSAKVNKLISYTDKEKSTLAHFLHENVAQSLSASKLYIEMALNGEKLMPFYLKSALDGITATIDLAKSFSNKIPVPDTSEVDVVNLFPDLINTFGKNNGIHITYYCDTAVKETITPKTSSVIFNIMQSQLRDCVLSKTKSIKVRLEYKKAFELYIQQDSRIALQCDVLTEARIQHAKGALVIEDDTYHTAIPLLN